MRMTASSLSVVGRATLGGMLHAFGVLRLGGLLRAKGRRRRVAFQSYSVHLAQCYATIIEQLRRDFPDLDIDFIVLPHPHFPLRAWRELREFATEVLGFPERNVRPYWQTIWDKYDFLICTDVYARFPLRATKRVLLKHGVGVASRVVEPHMFRKTAFDFDLVLVSGQVDYETLVRAAPPSFAATKVVAAGLPYVDRLERNEGGRDDYLRRLDLDTDKPIVLLAPSWNGLIEAEAREPRYFDNLVQSLLELDVQTIVKLHACSLNEVMAGGHDWAAKLERYRRLGAHIDNDIDDVPAMQNAHVLITDISSRAFNFMLLGKPVILVHSDGLVDNEIDRQRLRVMRDGALTVRSASELKTLLARGLRDPRALKNGDNEVVSRCFANRGHATEAVVEQLLKQIDATD